MEAKRARTWEAWSVLALAAGWLGKEPATNAGWVAVFTGSGWAWPSAASAVARA